MSNDKPIPQQLKEEAERKYPYPEFPQSHRKYYTKSDWDLDCKFKDTARSAYITGVLSRSGGVWVKASERLPETDGMVFIRNIMTRHGGMIHTNELAKMENLFNVEWLSESPAADKGDAIEFLRFTVKNNFVLYETEFWARDNEEKFTYEQLYELFLQSK